MEGWGLAFLGIIALCGLVQTVAIVVLAVGGVRLARQVREIDRRIQRELLPTLENVSRLTKNFAEISDRARIQAARVDAMVGDVLARVDDLGSMVTSVVRGQAGWLGDIAGIFRGVRRGLDVYHRLRGLERGDRGGVRRYSSSEDDHLFI
jgi:hypothetical protein